MTLEQIKDEIRSLRSSERIELYKWLDYGVVADYGVATDFCPRIGMDRSLEIHRWTKPLSRKNRASGSQNGSWDQIL